MNFDLGSATQEERELAETIWELYRMLFPWEIGFIHKDRTAVIITDDFLQTLRGKSGSEEATEFETYGWPTDYNALTLISRDPTPRFTVVMKRSCFADDTFQHTLPHELTHVADYSFLFDKHGNLYAACEEEKERVGFWAYSYWSEFHAKATGTKVYAVLKSVEETGWPENGVFKYGLVEFHTESLVQVVEELEQSRSTGDPYTNRKFWNFIQEFMGYLGRLSVFQNPKSARPPDKQFPSNALQRVLGPGILDVYPILVRMTSADNALAHVDELDVAIKRLRDHLNIKTLRQTLWME